MIISPSVFARACDPNYKPSSWQAYVSAIVSAAVRQGGARIIINTPPRHGKSRLMAVETPLWWMLEKPGCECVVSSYALGLAKKHSKQARDRVENETFRALTNARLRDDSAKADEWQLTNGSSYKAIGVDGGLTGFGADLLILDDLHKDAKEANSETKRDAAWDWLQSVAMTRLSPNASVILIGTRWHKDDVTGRLLAQEDGEWLVINLPALAHANDELGRHPDEPLWPERFPTEALKKIRQGASRYFWSALYDGNPVADTGNHVNTSLFHFVDQIQVTAKSLRQVRFWDLAVTENTAADFTAGALCGRDLQGNLWIIDVRRGQWEWTQGRGEICRNAMADRCQVGVETVGTQKGLAQNLREHFPGDIPLTTTTPERDKLTRALPWFSMVNTGRVYMVNAPWNRDFVDECQAFPLGAHDDQVDAVSGAYDLLFGGAVSNPLIVRESTNRVAQAFGARRERTVLL